MISMSELETQIAKIQFGNPKATTTHVFVMAEQAFNGSSELYLITELPMLNPAAFDECDRIANALAASLRRTYRALPNKENFELALAGLNDELGKLTAQGKTHWIGKLNALVAVKEDSKLSLASTGKITALLYRDDEFTSITDTNPNSNPLKAFEDFSIGKLHMGDIIILSTNQLFNNISADRIRNILNNHTLPLAGQEILRILQENTGPETAFGSLLGLMVEPGTTQVEQVALEDYVAPAKMHKKMALQAVHTGQMAMQRAWQKTKAFTLKTKDRIAKQDTGDIKTVLIKNKDLLNAVGNQAKNNFTIDKFAQLSKQKKFLFVSAIVLLIALGTNIFLAQKFKSTAGDADAAQVILGNVQTLVNDGNAALLYGDENQSRSLFAQAKEQFASLPSKLEKDEQKSTAENLSQQLSELEGKLEKKTTIEASSIATLSLAERLINLPRYVATQTGQSIVSFDRNTDKVEDAALIASQSIEAAQYVRGNQAVIYSGDRLFLWNFANSTTGTGIDTQVPEPSNWAGLYFYPTNNRVYLIDKSIKQVINYTVSDREISKPAVSFSAPELADALDLAVDGNMYVLTKNTVLKYQSGKPLTFDFPQLGTPLSGRGRIWTDSATTNVYVLDSDNKRILVLNKNGQLVQSIYSNQFTNPKDFIVDEKNKIILVLNDTTLLKLNF